MCEKFIIYDEWGDFPEMDLTEPQVGEGGRIIQVSFPARKENFFHKLWKESKSEEVKDTAFK